MYLITTKIDDLMNFLRRCLSWFGFSGRVWRRPCIWSLRSLPVLSGDLTNKYIWGYNGDTNGCNGNVSIFGEYNAAEVGKRHILVVPCWKQSRPGLIHYENPHLPTTRNDFRTLLRTLIWAVFFLIGVPKSMEQCFQDVSSIFSRFYH